MRKRYERRQDVRINWRKGEVRREMKEKEKDKNEDGMDVWKEAKLTKKKNEVGENE
jgi:hypothetical protein